MMKNHITGILFTVSLSFSVASAASAQVSGLTEGTFSNFRFSEVNKETQEELAQFEPSSDEIIEGELTSKLIFRRTDLTENREFDNFFEFSSTAFTNVEIGQPFVLGYFSYKNGRFFLNSDSDQIRTLFVADLTANIDSPQPEFIQSFTTRIGLDITPNIGNLEHNADIIYFLDHPEYGSFRIYEDQEATVEILGIFSSLNLDLVGFGNILSGEGTGFTNQSIERFAIPEPLTLLGTATAICFGAIFKRKSS